MSTVGLYTFGSQAQVISIAYYRLDMTLKYLHAWNKNLQASVIGVKNEDSIFCLTFI